MVQPVFISHSSLDKATADTVCRFLEAQGIVCWIAPRNVPPGAKYGETIVHAIENAQALVLIFSEHSNASEQVMNEIERAVSKKKPILPLKISPTMPCPELEFFISRRHWLDLTLAPLDTTLAQLAAALQNLTAQEEEPTVLRSAGVVWKPGLVFVSRSTVGVLALALAVWLGSRLWRAPVPELPLEHTPHQEQAWQSSSLPSQIEAYQALDQGDIDQAAALFQQLTAQDKPQLQSQGYTGLAAVAWAREDAQQTLERAAQAERLDPEVVYSQVLRGHLLWQQEKMTEAAVAYRTATAKAHGLPWQYAVAYNRLGRLYAMQGDTVQALEHYDKALSQPASGHPDRVIAHTNKGYLLATLGKFQEAAAHYRQAQQLSPADRLSAALLHEVEQRARAAQDREKQERIDQLVASLLRAYKEGRQPPEQGDGWTSIPLTLAFLHLHTQGTPAPRAGGEEVLLLRLTDALHATGRITVLERDILDKILAELQLSASALTDPQVAVRVGRILAARLLATGTLTRRGAEAQLSLRVVETETTRLRAAVTDTLAPALEIEGMADQLAATLFQKLRTAYPLQGRILQATSQGILLNIGAEQGVTPGITLHVLNEELLRLDGKEAGSHRVPVGLIEVTRVEPRLSQARVLEQTVAFEPGWKVKER